MNTDYSYKFYATTKEAWDGMMEALKMAQSSIYWEVYIFVDDHIGTAFLDILEAKAKSGVTVRFVVDAVGSISFSKEAEKRLKEAGVDFLKYNALYPEIKVSSWLHRIFNRNHRKVLIVDERVVFLGGVNVRDAFHEWDDLYIRIEGPVTRPLLRGFAKSYISAGGNPKAVSRLLHPKLKLISTWKEKLQFIVHSPRYRASSHTHRLYIQALNMANETVNLVSPYFVPNKEFLRSLALARKRGVKVQIFLPLRTDKKIAEIVNRAYYQLAAKAGASIYFLPHMNHAKGVSVDKQFGAVGSINLSRRASQYDQEAGVTFTDTDMVEDLDKLFNIWKEKSTPFDGTAWTKRGLLERIQEWIAKKLENFI